MGLNKKDKLHHFYVGDIYAKIIILCCAIFAFCIGQWPFAIFMIAAFMISFCFSELSYQRGVHQMRKYLEHASTSIGASESMPGFPFPAVSVTKNGKITWYNKAMEKLLDGAFLFQKSITEYVKDFSSEKVDAEGKTPFFSAEIGDKVYAVYAHQTPAQEGTDTLILLYFIDTTKEITIEKKYDDSRFVSMIITFDNYEEVMQGISDSVRSNLQATIDKILVSEITDVGGIIKKTERDRYIVSLSMAALRSLMNKKFSVLDTVRDTKLGNLIAPTLSIGVGIDAETYHECNEYARAALDMALGRGGDQVVIKDNTEMHYFGGKTREVEKRTKVKARVVAYALRESILQSSNIIITGHKNPDADCVGAAMGMVAIARHLGKRAHILLHGFDDAASSIVKSAQKITEYKNIFIKRNMLEELVSSKTLLIVVDTNASSYMEEPECLQIFSQVVLIDHHRKSPNFIKEAVLAYHEPYASSTSEMITEMLPYLDNKSNLLKIEAEALFAGIYLDTKGFTFKTGVRTLESATFLRRAGVEPVIVKQFFKNNFQSYTRIASLIQSATIYYGQIAIVATDEEHSPSLIAQTADELLNITDIDTAFVLAQHGGSCIVSGRSTGEVNVQVLLEKLGGGGHFSVAGAQVKDMQTEEVKTKLLDILKEYYSEK